MNLEDLSRAISPIWNAVRSSVVRAVVRLSDDTPKLQTVQVDLGHGDVRSDVERWQTYGMSSRPHDGAEALYLAPGGERSAGLVIAVEDRRYRLQNLANGEVAIYTDEGTAIHLKRGNIVEIAGAQIKVNATASVAINAPEIDLNGGRVTISATTQFKVKAPDIAFEG